MKIIADGHIHFYSCYDYAKAFQNLWQNLEKISEDKNTVKVAFLTERKECRFFRDCVEGKIQSPFFKIEKTSEKEALLVTLDEGRKIYLISGRQINTKERIEVLGLLTDALIPDGLSLGESIERLKVAGAIPAITWAFGKWSFQRGKTVLGLVEKAQRGDFLLGDSSLRPRGLGWPAAMKLAFEKNIPVLAGTDPLPLAGEETVMGSYGFLMEGDLNEKQPVTSLKNILTSGGSGAFLFRGRRNGIVKVVSRIARYHLKEKF